MTFIDSVTLGVDDPDAANHFYEGAFGLGDRLRVRAADPRPATGFRGFTLSLTVSRPGTVDARMARALDAGATSVKPAAKSFWGYGGVVRAPDGALWKIATSARKNTGPATRRIDRFVLLLGVGDVLATKRFYAAHGLPSARASAGGVTSCPCRRSRSSRWRSRRAVRWGRGFRRRPGWRPRGHPFAVGAGRKRPSGGAGRPGGYQALVSTAISGTRSLRSVSRKVTTSAATERCCTSLRTS